MEIIRELAKKAHRASNVSKTGEPISVHHLTFDEFFGWYSVTVELEDSRGNPLRTKVLFKEKEEHYDVLAGGFVVLQAPKTEDIIREFETVNN